MSHYTGCYLYWFSRPGGGRRFQNSGRDDRCRHIVDRAAIRIPSPLMALVLHSIAILCIALKQPRLKGSETRTGHVGMVADVLCQDFFARASESRCPNICSKYEYKRALRPSLAPASFRVFRNTERFKTIRPISKKVIFIVNIWSIRPEYVLQFDGLF